MRAYALLFIAVIAEIIATSALKMSYGLSKLYPSLVVVCGYSLAFWFMSISLKTMPVSILYSLWAGLGVLGIAAIGVFYFKEAFSIWHFLGTFLIITGIVILCLVTDIH